MSELRSALDGLAGDDLLLLGDADLLDRTAELVRARNRIDAELARTVRRAEAIQAPECDGLTSMRSWLRTHARLSGGAVGRLVDAGRALASLPVTETAFAAGEITAEQVAVIAPITSPARLQQAAEQGVDVAGIETELVALATTVPHQRLREAVHFYVSRLDPDGTEPDPTEGRSLTMSTAPRRNVARHLRARRGGWREGRLRHRGHRRSLPLRRRRAHRRAAPRRRARAALRPRARLGSPAHAADGEAACRRHHLRPGPGRPARGARGGPHRDGRADLRRQGALAGLRQQGHPHRARAGQPASGRRPRGALAPPHLRKAVVERDRDCVFAGCEAPSWWCDVHHLVEWIDDGETSLDNSALLCERHHTKVHHGFRVERDDGAPPGQRWRTWRPEGTEIVLHPHLSAA